MSVFMAGDGSTQDGVAGSGKEYRAGQYIYQNKKNPLPDYQQNSGFRNGVGPDFQDMLGSKIKDKKIVFIEPLNITEQETWLDNLIVEILALNKKEFCDLLASEVEYLLNLIIPVLEKEPIIIEVEAPVVIAGDTHG